MELWADPFPRLYGNCHFCDLEDLKNEILVAIRDLLGEIPATVTFPHIDER
jgi:hypothetical protein